MIHLVYCTRYLGDIYTEYLPPLKPLLVDTQEVNSHASTALLDTLVNNVLLDDFNIHYSTWGDTAVGQD